MEQKDWLPKELVIKPLSVFDRYTGSVSSTAAVSQNIVVSGVGNNRPYDGQALYFDRKYFVVKDITVTNGGSGYT